ncbi:SDR family oxidoreductase [Corynebacterium jeikeium]|uniref:SDR family oxidoreductase n=1 Tax=Corynebacterium jeikeium TaxID=38289 RepID=UPI0001B71B0E|nr:SDR family oxidoreductase [Corynebacterium jeikeium]EEW17341.1 oxidoreductase, short chain dehydrogenase/reductase family protein [Corynebacterium jeikeium ATCC 43734]OOD30798.1 short chain dehydrogenase [Corynebacterium jeikeium]WCZ54089.1 Benzil reductase ((S)-benzoin forming) [Corynebacterium jeikeium]SUY80605.1 short chain dehydrogenase [Corynebacterium jeikeium]
MDRKTALITGGTRGIGLAIARELQDDYHLIIGGSSEKAHDVAAQFPSAQGFVADLADTEGIGAAVAELGLERLDVLVHSAGVVAHDPVTETTPEQWKHAFDINLFAVAELTRQLLDALQAAHGTVVTINSGAGFRSSVGFGPYATTKFALRAYTDALREEQRDKIRVSSIHPGKVDSDMQRQIQTHRGVAEADYDETQYLRPESVAKAVRLAIDATDDAMVESLTIRPVNGR